MTTQVKEPTTAAAPAAIPAVSPETAAAPAEIAPETTVPVTVDPAAGLTREKRKFTVAEYYRMAEVGILDRDERVELIDGEIVVMAPMGERHANGVRRIDRVLHRVLGDAGIISVQCPLRLDDHSEPEPDIALLRFREDGYIAHPGPADVLVVMEVSDSTLDFDREVKSKRYAAAGIPEMWVMNLPGDCLDRLDQPGPAGYARHTVFRRGEKISPAALPDLAFAVADLLPPRLVE